MTPASTSPAIPALWPSAPTRSPRRSQPRSPRAGCEAAIVRNGSRGAYFLEPLVEVADAQGPHRLRAGEASRRDVAVRCRLPRRRPAHPLAGRTEEIPFLAEQTRLTFARCGVIDPLSLDDYRGAWRAGGPAKARRDDARRHRQGQSPIRPARPRRRRLPDRHQVEDRARHGRRPQIHRLQCRRGRLRHLRRPHDHGGRPLRAHRGHGDRRHRGRRDQGLSSISARNIRMPSPTCTRRSTIARKAGVLGSMCSARPTPSTWKSASAPAPMSAAKRPRC